MNIMNQCMQYESVKTLGNIFFAGNKVLVEWASRNEHVSGELKRAVAPNTAEVGAVYCFMSLL